MATGNQWAAWRSLPRKTVAINVSVPMKYYNKAGKEPIWVYEAPARARAASLSVFSSFAKTNRNKSLFNDVCFWMHVAFSAPWVAQRGAAGNLALVIQAAGAIPLFLHPEIRGAKHCSSLRTGPVLANPCGMAMQCGGRAKLSFLAASRTVSLQDRTPHCN